MGILDPIETLRRVPFFAALRPQELEILASHCVVRHLAKDEMLFAEGDPCEGLFVVQSGVLKLLKMSETGREQVLATERAGSTVGELALFDGGSFPATAAAVEPSSVLYLPKREFLEMCKNSSEVAFAVIRRQIAWTRETCVAISLSDQLGGGAFPERSQPPAGPVPARSSRALWRPYEARD